jgi:hypothetical protein
MGGRHGSDRGWHRGLRRGDRRDPLGPGRASTRWGRSRFGRGDPQGRHHGRGERSRWTVRDRQRRLGPPCGTRPGAGQARVARCRMRRSQRPRPCDWCGPRRRRGCPGCDRRRRSDLRRARGRHWRGRRRRRRRRCRCCAVLRGGRCRIVQRAPARRRGLRLDRRSAPGGIQGTGPSDPALLVRGVRGVGDDLRHGPRRCGRGQDRTGGFVPGRWRRCQAATAPGEVDEEGVHATPRARVSTLEAIRSR